MGGLSAQWQPHCTFPQSFPLRLSPYTPYYHQLGASHRTSFIAHPPVLPTTLPPLHCTLLSVSPRRGACMTATPNPPFTILHRIPPVAFSNHPVSHIVLSSPLCLSPPSPLCLSPSSPLCLPPPSPFSLSPLSPLCPSPSPACASHCRPRCVSHRTPQ